MRQCIFILSLFISASAFAKSLSSEGESSSGRREFHPPV